MEYLDSPRMKKKFDEDGREIIAENVPIIIQGIVEVSDDE